MKSWLDGCLCFTSDILTNDRLTHSAFWRLRSRKIYFSRSLRGMGCTLFAFLAACRSIAMTVPIVFHSSFVASYGMPRCATAYHGMPRHATALPPRRPTATLRRPTANHGNPHDNHHGMRWQPPLQPPPQPPRHFKAMTRAYHGNPHGMARQITMATTATYRGNPHSQYRGNHDGIPRYPPRSIPLHPPRHTDA